MAGEPSLVGHKVLIERGHLVPLGGRAALLHNSRVVLTGDAGGLVEPLLAEGIYYALRSGQIAAEVIADSFRREDLDLSEHTRRVEAEILPEFQNSAGMASLVYRFPRAMLTALSVASPLRNVASRMMEGHGNLSRALWGAGQAIGNLLDSR